MHNRWSWLALVLAVVYCPVANITRSRCLSPANCVRTLLQPHFIFFIGVCAINLISRLPRHAHQQLILFIYFYLKSELCDFSFCLIVQVQQKAICAFVWTYFFFPQILRILIPQDILQPPTAPTWAVHPVHHPHIRTSPSLWSAASSQAGNPEGILPTLPAFYPSLEHQDPPDPW